MKCGLCGKELEEVVGQPERCGQCPGGGCKKIHCPACGYANPVVPGYLKRFITKTDDKKE